MHREIRAAAVESPARTQTAPGLTPALSSTSASGTPVNSPALTAQVVVDSELISSVEGNALLLAPLRALLHVLLVDAGRLPRALAQVIEEAGIVAGAFGHRAHGAPRQLLQAVEARLDRPLDFPPTASVQSSG